MKLTISEIAFLSGVAIEKTQLGLFENISVDLDGTEEISLAEKDVYRNGVLSPSAKEILDIVSGARRSSRIMLKDNYCAIEKYTYRNDNKIILVENDDADLFFSMPQDFTETLSELSEFTGMSRIKAVDIEVLLPVFEMMVLLAVIDLYRSSVLSLYLDSSKTMPEIHFADIVGQLNQPMSNSLVQMLKKNYNYDIPQPEITSGILEKLIQEEHLSNGYGFKLSDKLSAFATNFMIPETIVAMEAFSLNEKNEIVSASALGVCAGVKDIAYFIMSGDEIELSSISSMQLLQMIESFLSCPDLA